MGTGTARASIEVDVGVTLHAGDRVSSDEIDFALYAFYCGTSQGTVNRASVWRVCSGGSAVKSTLPRFRTTCAPSGGFLWEVLQNLSNSLSSQSRRRAIKDFWLENSIGWRFTNLIISCRVDIDISGLLDRLQWSYLTPLSI